MLRTSPRFALPLLSLVSLLGGLSVLPGCATKGTAVRELAARELACPSSAVRVTHTDGRFYRATGCGSSVEVACYDPYESTGAAKGWADGASAGKRVHCETLQNRAALTSARATPPAPAAAAPASPAAFDRALAAKLLAAAAERSRSCGVAGVASGAVHARITFSPDGSVAAVEVDAPFTDTEVARCVSRELSRVSLPSFTGAPITVGKHFEIADPRGDVSSGRSGG